MDEREKRGFDDRLNDIYSTYRTGRLIAGLGKTLSAARSAIAAAGVIGSGGWVALIVGTALIIILVPTFLIVLGGGGAASEVPPGEQTATQQPSGLLNIKGAMPQEIEEINNILSTSLASSTYADLLRGPVEIIIESGGCSGLVDRGSVTLYSFSSCGGTFKRYLVLHEMGHIIHARNGRLAQTFNHLEYVRLEPGCYNSEGYLITYPKPEGKANAFNESFAEAIALYTVYKEQPPLTDFPNQCPNTYNWVKNNIFR